MRLVSTKPGTAYSRDTDPMTQVSRPTKAGWWRVLLAALAAALVGLLGAGTASATTLPAAETRVGASTPATVHVVGVHESITAGQRWGNAPPQAVSASATGVAANGGVTRVFRVEGPGNARLGIDGAGNVSVHGDQTLFLNFGDEARAQAFLAKRLAQGHEGTTIKSFDVPNSYVDSIRARAVPESMARGNSVFQVDVGQTSGSFGLRGSELPGLRCAIVPGSGC